MSETTPPAQPPIDPVHPPVDPVPPAAGPVAPPPAEPPTPPAAPAEPVQPAYAPAPAAQPAYAPATPAYAPAQPGYGYPQGGAPAGPVPGAPGGPGKPGGNFRSSRAKTIGLIVAGVLAVGAIGGIGAAVLGGDESDDFSSSTGGQQPGEEVTPDASGGGTEGGGILDPSPIGSATPEPSTPPSDQPSEESSPTDLPTDGTSPTLEPEPTGDVVTIGNGVQVPVLPGWQVAGQGDSDVLLGDGNNSFVYAVTGTVDPSTDAASVIAASLDNILPKQSYTQLRKTDIEPLQAFGSVVSMAGMQYRATWTDQQASVPLQGLLICAVRQDGTAIILTAEHAPPDEFQDSAQSWGPVLNATLGLFGAA
jgi:hypothetical protein